MPEALAGHEVVVAGGAGGIGSALSELLFAEGARVVIGYRSNSARAKKLAGRLKGCTPVQGDITTAAGRSSLLDSAPGLYGLVVLAGDPARAADSSHMEEVMERSHAANYMGPILLARDAAGRMKATQTPGSIVLVATMQALALFPGSTAYAGAKAALLHAARILAKECRGASGIRVNVVSPGVTAAGMAEASIASGKYDRYLNEGVVARFGRAADVARAIRFFLEPDNYITGQVLAVDGGITL